MQPAPPPKADRSLGSLFSDLMENLSQLLRQEVELAKTEMSQKVSRLSKDVISLLIGGVVAYTGLLALVASAILGLALVLPAWASALIVGTVIALIGGLMLMLGLRDLKQIDPVPEKTIQTLKDDAKWVREQTR